MINSEKHLDKNNYDNIYLRCAIVGFLGFLKNKFKWFNIGENGEYEVNLPIHYSLTGDNRYIMDAFYDDMPQDRVNMNTDSIPRGIITLKSWNIKSDEFTNPNIWYNVNKEIDGELVQLASQIKAVPIKLTFSLETIFDNEIDVYKCWQSYMENLWIYKYFTFDYKRLPINAVFNFIGDTENPVVRDNKFGDGQEVLKTVYDFEIHTFFPIIDYSQQELSNNGVQWILQIWQANNLTTP